MQFALWPKDLLCVLCESLAFFAVKFFFTAKLVRSAGEPRWSGRPRPPTLFADVLTAKNPISIKGQDECSTNLSFRIRFSGEESALPASRFRDTRRCPVSRHSVRRRIPALIETDSYQGTPSGVPPTTHPAGPRPSGATATARSFTLPSHQSPAAHESWVCSRRVVFGWVDSGELKHCFYIAPVALQSAGDSARCFLQFALLGGGRKGRGRHIGSGRGLSCGRGRFRLRHRRRRRCTRFFRGRGHGERGRSPHIGLFFK